MIWIALAAQLSAPTPKEVWLNRADFPSRLMPVTSWVQLLLRVVVSPDGSIESCGVEDKTDSRIEAKVEAYTCDLTMKRASFLPARSTDGKASYGVYRLPVVWEMSHYVRKSFADLTLDVNQLPNGVKSPVTLQVVFAADPDGTVSSCEARNAGQNPDLAFMACDQLKKQFKAFAPQTPAGAATTSIQNGFVMFEVKRAR